MRVYLGCPIDHSNSETPPMQQIRNLSGLVVGTLGDDTVCYNPFGAFLNAEKVTGYAEIAFVCRMNDMALASCDAAVFVWDGSPSFGVPVEINFMANAKKRFIVWNRSGKPAGLYLRERVQRGSGVIVESAAELVAALQGFLKSDGACS